MWTETDQKDFRRLYREFVAGRPGKSKAEKITIARYFTEKSFPKLAAKFLRLSEQEQLRARAAINAAWKSRLCCLCKSCFVLKDVCRNACLKTLEGRALSKRLERERACATMIERHGGIGNSSPQVKRKADLTSLRRYGTTVPLAYNKEVRARAQQTMIERHGGRYVAHCPALMKRVQRSTYGVHEFEFGGRRFEYQGYEAKAIRWLCSKYGYDPKEIETQYDNPRSIFYDNGGRQVRYTPDLFLKEVNLNIEVKCPFTLMGTKKDDRSFHRNRKIQSMCNRRGFPLRFVVVTKSGVAFPLPKAWDELSKKDLLNLIERKERGA